MLRVGLTGGIGSGKSTVAGALEARGAVLVDGDRIAREIVEPGGPAYRPVVDRFGPRVVRPDGVLDRGALAAIVFSDPAALADLNALTHPVIARVMLERVASESQGGRPIILDIPLLSAESLASYGLSGVIVVDTPEEVAIQRLVTDRGFSEADARARVAAQISRDERRRFADLVIDNSHGKAALARQIDRAWAWIEGLHGAN